MPVPALSLDQRRAASAKAIASRRARAAISRSLKAGQLSISALLSLAERDEAVGGMRVSAVLAALPRYGPTRAADALVALRVAPSRRLRGLGPTQRAGLLALDTWSRPDAAPSDPGGSDPPDGSTPEPVA